MFIIIGGDGKEYGPASATQVRGWIDGGRANGDTRARRAAGGEWRRLADFVEFGGTEGATPALVAEPAAEAEGGAGLPELASPASRLLARVVDGALELLASVPAVLLALGELPRIFAAVLEVVRGGEFNPESLDWSKLGPAVAALVIAQVALLGVQVWLLGTQGQTLGKLLLGVRVVRTDGDGPPGILRAWLLRELPTGIIQGFLQLVPFLGLFLRFAFLTTNYLMIFREDRRCLHDFIAGTRVVRR